MKYPGVTFEIEGKGPQTERPAKGWKRRAKPAGRQSRRRWRPGGCPIGLLVSALKAVPDFALNVSPLCNGAASAAAGTLTFLIGGETDVVENAKLILAAMGKKLVHCGGAGAGQAAKICNNMILGISMIAVSEAFVLGEKLGLSDQALFDVAFRPPPASAGRSPPIARFRAPCRRALPITSTSRASPRR